MERMTERIDLDEWANYGGYKDFPSWLDENPWYEDQAVIYRNPEGNITRVATLVGYRD